MRAAVRALLGHILDYAGMFPPAKLPMADALRNYTALAAGPNAWMLGRFVCAAARLDELLAMAQPSLTVAALGRGGKTAAEFIDNLGQDLRDIERFRGALGREDAVDVLEVALPAGATVGEAVPLLEGARLRGYFEVPFDGDWRPAVRANAKPQAAGGVGLKIRCGGSAVPSPEDVAFFIARCRDADLPWKATAGLHHPLWNPATRTHGFLNVFIAGILARTQALDDGHLTGLLTSDVLADFRLTDETLGWKSWTCPVDTVREVRANWLPSFGSCSFEEPWTDLQQLGLVE